MAKAFTTKSVEAFKADPDRRREIPDAGLSGLYLVIQPSGAKSWAVRYRYAGRPRKYTLGSFPAIPLADQKAGRKVTLKGARTLAREVLAKISEGADPANDRRGPDPSRDLFKNVCEQFLERHVRAKRRPVYAADVERILNKDVLPKWGKRPIGDIGKRDVLDLLDRMVDAGRALSANRVLAVVRKFFNWAIERDIITTNPCQGIKAPAEERTRERILDDAELRAVWNACGQLGYPFGPLVRLLILTGQRRNEVAGMTRDEITEAVWHISGERTKNGEPHDVPLADLAQETIDGLPVIRTEKGKPSYLFTTNAKTHVTGYSRAKARLDKLVRKELGDIERWTLHDLRRTTASGMARLGVPLPTVEKVLNHTSGSFAGIVATYQRHTYADEKRHALEMWARHIETITGDQSGKVVELRAAE